MKKVLFVIACLVTGHLFGQSQNSQVKNYIERPKLVVGIVVDQMRWDFLYRYYDRYSSTGGFKRFLNNGFSCENTLIPYIPTVTACGHTCIYTGSVPSIHGISGNSWWDNELMRTVYCTEDKTVKAVGGNPFSGEMSPHNMLVTTIGDEMRLSTNFRSKVIGIAIKDRGAIFPAGHSANGAFWYDSRSGNFMTSTYYSNELPKWLDNFNSQKLVDQYYQQNWNTLYPINTYLQSTADEKQFEGKPFGQDSKGFPYDLRRFIGKNYGTITGTPYGNTLTEQLAKAAITGEQLGSDNNTDLLTISFSSPDIIGHSFGPNSIEVEDTYLRLDKDLGDLFNFLDVKVGKSQYLVFLSADHGVVNVPAFLNENKIPTGVLSEGADAGTLNKKLTEKFGNDRLVMSMNNNQVQFNHSLMDSLKLDETAVKNYTIAYLESVKGIGMAFDLTKVMDVPLNRKLREFVANGYFPKRCGDIQFILQPQWLEGGNTGTGHGAWNPYDSHIPLLWYGWKVKQGKTNRETYMTDIAPTIAAMLRIQMPSGSIGNVIEEVIR